MGLNILLFVNSYLPVIGGREIVVHYLAKAYKKMGHSARVVGPAGLFRHRNLKFDYPVHRWPTLRRFFKEEVMLAQLHLDLAIWGADVIHAHSTYPCGYIVSKLKNKKPIPLVLTPHGQDIHIIPEIGFGSRLDPEKDHKIKIALDRAQNLTAISNSIKQSIIDAGGQENKIRLIPNGIDVDRFRNDFGSRKNMLNIEGEKKQTILTVGRYHKRKGFEVLLKSLPLIIKSLPNVQLIIVGESNEKLTSLIQELKINKYVTITGEIEFPVFDSNISMEKLKKDRLAKIYQTSNVYVSSAIEEGAEGLSLALLDGMAAGLPIVATNVSGNRDLIKPYENGLLVPPADPTAMGTALIKMLSDDSLSKYCKKKNQEISDNYSWESVALQYIDTYKEAMQLI